MGWVTNLNAIFTIYPNMIRSCIFEHFTVFFLLAFSFTNSHLLTFFRLFILYLSLLVCALLFIRNDAMNYGNVIALKMRLSNYAYFAWFTLACAFSWQCVFGFFSLYFFLSFRSYMHKMSLHRKLRVIWRTCRRRSANKIIIGMTTTRNE